MRKRGILAAGALAAAIAVPAALGGGGSPGVLSGGKGVAAPGGAVRYVTFSKNGGTVVAAVLANGGQIARFRWMRGSYGIPLVTVGGATEGLTRDGRTLVLAPAGVAAPTTATSRFALVDTATLRVRRVLILQGSFSYDALSPDAKTLYLIQNLDQGLYRVRAYDLARGQLLPGAIVDPKEADEPMVGSPATRATSASGAWVYTLYVRGDAPPFIHALNAASRKAVCVDLPWSGAQDPLWQMRLGLTSGGKKLVLRQQSGKAAIVVDTRTFEAKKV